MNRLANALSPYLRQHKDNPVDWYPWGEEAFTAAKEQDKAILISVGYSACHWCHVMAHESFEDPNVAAVMNEHFINVKVDREEHPDVDALYMDAVQTMTGQGGWPMTVFTTPDGRPFFAGTYFPKEARHGYPGFTDVLNGVNDAWQNQRADVVAQSEQLVDAIRQRSRLGQPADDVVDEDLLEQSATQTLSQHDPEWGGFGRAPKFPQAAQLEMLLTAAWRGVDGVLDAVRTTLDAMASGGIYDHLGGGFSRYSVDAFWMVPHFEKMLTDQAQLLRVFLHAWQLTGEPTYRQVTEEVATYVLRDLRLANATFATAEDADSEGEEGKFYVWRPEEIDDVLGDDSAAVREWYGVTKSGNFEGSNILHRPVRADLIRPEQIESGRERLLEARSKRFRPGLDDKAVVEYNAMMIAALAEAGFALDRSDWVDAATDAAEALMKGAQRDDGRWLRLVDGSGTTPLAYAADYVQLIDAFLSLAAATGRREWEQRAKQTADELLELFTDEDGALFTSGRDAPSVVVRGKEFLDGAFPSANGAASLVLQRLTAVTGVETYTEAASRILHSFGTALTGHPTAFPVSVMAQERLRSGFRQLVVAGDNPTLARAGARAYLPDLVRAWGEPGDGPLWEGREAAQAYLCEYFVCQQPTADLAQLELVLSRTN